MAQAGVRSHQKAASPATDGAERIAQHYGYALSHAFDVAFPGAPALIIVEDDFVFAPDFYEYFHAVGPLLEADSTLWLASAWVSGPRAGGRAAGCGCGACGGGGGGRGHTRAYVHHLLHSHEMTAQVLLEMHNTLHYAGFFAAVRAAIQAGRFGEYRAWFLRRRERWLMG